MFEPNMILREKQKSGVRQEDRWEIRLVTKVENGWQCEHLNKPGGFHARDGERKGYEGRTYTEAKLSDGFELYLQPYDLRSQLLGF